MPSLPEHNQARSFDPEVPEYCTQTYERQPDWIIEFRDKPPDGPNNFMNLFPRRARPYKNKVRCKALSRRSPPTMTCATTRTQGKRVPVFELSKTKNSGMGYYLQRAAFCLTPDRNNFLRATQLHVPCGGSILHLDTQTLISGAFRALASLSTSTYCTRNCVSGSFSTKYT